MPPPDLEELHRLLLETKSEAMRARAASERAVAMGERSVGAMANMILQVKRSDQQHANRMLRFEAAMLQPEILADLVTKGDLDAARQISRKRALTAQVTDREPERNGNNGLQRQDDTGVFDKTHSDGRERKLHEMLGALVVVVAKKGWPALLAAGGYLIHLIQTVLQHKPVP